jgi:hypothetical protein
VLTDPAQREEYDTYLRMSSVFKKLSTSPPSTDKALPAGKRDITDSPEQVTGHLNVLLWDIEDFIQGRNEEYLNSTYGDRTVRHYLLLILTFIDKWVLETAGYPDYFMEARQLKKIDPRDYVTMLEGKRDTGIHIPYAGLTDYFYDVRKRMDRFLANISIRDLFEKTAGPGLRLIDCVIEAQNFSVHYLSYLLNFRSDLPENIPPFHYSHQSF